MLEILNVRKPQTQNKGALRKDYIIENSHKNRINTLPVMSEI